jgi:hypothetical protein
VVALREIAAGFITPDYPVETDESDSSGAIRR